MVNRIVALNWYYIDGGQKTGPLTDAQLDALVGAGKLTPDSLVWREGMPEWQPYGRVRSVPASVAPPNESGRMSCALCSESFAPDEMIAFENAWVCAACKPQFVQRVREGLSVGHCPGNAWRDGDLVVTIAGSTLTGRCVKCNGVESLSHTSGTLYWHPRWLYSLPLMVPTPSLLANSMRKSASVAVSICQRHRNMRRTMIAVYWASIFIPIGIGAAAMQFSSHPLLMVAGTVLAVGAIAILRQWGLGVSAAKIEGDYVWLRGCGRKFADALPEFSQHRANEREMSGESESRKQ